MEQTLGLFQMPSLGLCSKHCCVWFRRLVRRRYTARMYEKHIWICAFMVVGAAHKCNMGEVDANHADEVLHVQYSLVWFSALKAHLPDNPRFLFTNLLQEKRFGCPVPNSPQDRWHDELKESVSCS